MVLMTCYIFNYKLCYFASMLKFIINIFDRVFFTFAFIVGIQLPAFINAYQQQLVGRIDEANLQLQQFQLISELQFNGNLDELLASFRRNHDPAIQQTAQAITELITRLTTYQEQLNKINLNEYLTKFYHFITQLDISIAQSTLKHFTPAIPLELTAIATGFSMAVALTLLNQLTIWLAQLTYQRRKSSTA